VAAAAGRGMKKSFGWQDRQGIFAVA
jgi:hypothetical protein